MRLSGKTLLAGQRSYLVIDKGPRFVRCQQSPHLFATRAPVQPSSGRLHFSSSTVFRGDDAIGSSKDHENMTTLSPASAAAIARLRSYMPPPTSWHKLPTSRKAAVLILLYPDPHGDLRVVLTMRAATLSSYAGQAALPGGKADFDTESALRCARREAYEEIGLPLPDSSPSEPAPSPTLDGASQDALTETKFSPPTSALPHPFLLEHLCQLPCHLARTELGVRPCVALLTATSPVDKHGRPVNVESMLIPRLDAKEVAAVFTAPLHNFLRPDDELPPGASPRDLPPGKWYSGSWTEWYDGRFRMHNFGVPIRDQLVTRSAHPTPPKPGASASANELADPSPKNADPLDGLERYRVWGMTARMLLDCARLAYDEEPAFEHNSHFGDEGLIAGLYEMGRLKQARKQGEAFGAKDQDVREALVEVRRQEEARRKRGDSHL